MKIYMTFTNADMNAGSGPMIPSEAFLHKKHAEEYIDAQPGVQGRRAKWSEAKYGDWQVVEVYVHEGSLIEQQKKDKEDKAKALAKLTERERELLGLK